MINFQGVNFDLTMSRVTPIEAMNGQSLPQFQQLTEFLKTLELNNLLEGKNLNGKVVYADDQFVNMKTVQTHFESMQIADRLITFNNG